MLSAPHLKILNNAENFNLHCRRWMDPSSKEKRRSFNQNYCQKFVRRAVFTAKFVSFEIPSLAVPF